MVNAPKKRIRFERHPSQVVFDPSCSTFVVTWSRCGVPEEKRLESKRDILSWIPSISAIATLYDRGCIPLNQIVFAAMSVGRAWDAGDRQGLDTEDAKRAAELVRDLASMCVDVSSHAAARDMGQAMRHLLDEMAKVRFMNISPEEFGEDVANSLEKAVSECMSIPDFTSWPLSSMRRRFLFCLNRKERTPVAYALVSLMFDSGSCPILTLTSRRNLRMRALRASGMDLINPPHAVGDLFTVENMNSFFRYALETMREEKVSGKSFMEPSMMSQQFINSLEKSPA